jgi:hypothetical protein
LCFALSSPCGRLRSLGPESRRSRIPALCREDYRARAWFRGVRGRRQKSPAAAGRLPWVSRTPRPGTHPAGARAECGAPARTGVAPGASSTAAPSPSAWARAVHSSPGQGGPRRPRPALRIGGGGGTCPAWSRRAGGRSRAASAVLVRATYPTRAGAVRGGCPGSSRSCSACTCGPVCFA